MNKTKIKLFALAQLALSANSAIGAEHSLEVVELNKLEADTISGPAAKALLETLPPAKGANYDTLKKHFRSLVISVKGQAQAVEINCASAKWAYVGHGRASQLELVAMEPECEALAIDLQSGDSIDKKKLADVAAAAAQANQILAPLEEEKACHGRLCD